MKPGDNEFLVDTSVSKWTPIGRDYCAARGCDNRMTCCNIPFVRWSKSRINVHASLRDAAEFDRRATGFLFRDPQFGEQCCRRRIEMRAADRGNEASRRTSLRPEERFVFRLAYVSTRRQVKPLRTSSDNSTPHESNCGGRDNADDWSAVHHQRNIDGKLVSGGEKFFCAVERIDKREV